MADTLAICKCAILLALIACLQIPSTEGRKLKSMNKQELVSVKMNSRKGLANHGSNSINLHQNPTGTVEGSTSQPVSPSDHLSGSSGSSESPAADTDDFRPTPPGHSPGVGHSFLSGADHSNSKHSASESGDDYRPIHPGISGIGHPSAKDSEGSAEPKFPAGYKDDFRPTQPRFIPGVDHPLSDDSKEDTAQPKVPAGSISKHSVAGLTDDFRPTQPGHSPGVGHAFKTKSAKN